MLSFKNIYASIGEQENAQITPCEWAQKKRSLPRSFTSKPGRLDYSYSPYLIEIVNNFSANSRVEQTTLLKGSQIGATQLVIETILGYVIDVYPTSVLYISESKEVVLRDVSTRLDNMLYTTGIYDKIKPSAQFRHGKKTGNTKRVKEFCGGIIYAMGANEKPLSINAQYLIFDELDKAKDHKFGDMVEIWKKRTDIYSKNRRILYASTPHSLSGNRISNMFERGDKRYYFVSCPHCASKISFSWQNTITSAGIELTGKHNFEYEKQSDFEVLPESVCYLCNYCGGKIKDNEKYELLKKGVWQPTAEPQERNHRSYYLPQFLSNFVSWSQICNQWLIAGKDSEILKVFVNEVCAERWIDRENRADVKQIEAANTCIFSPSIIPNAKAQEHGHGKIVLITAGIDINKGSSGVDSQGWVAITICGHCADGSIYIISKGHIYGNIFTNGNVWNAVNEILQTPIKSDDGLNYNINCCAVDTGYNPDGNNIDGGNVGAVYKFTAENWQVKPIKGVKSITRSPIRFKKSTNENKRELYLIDTTRYKIDLFNRLLLIPNATTQPEGFINFAKEKALGGFEYLDLPKKYGVILEGNGFDEEFIKTFESEQPIFKSREKNEIIGFRKVNSRANNHDLDTIVYNLAAVDIYCLEFAKYVWKKDDESVLSVLEVFAQFLEQKGEPI